MGKMILLFATAALMLTPTLGPNPAPQDPLTTDDARQVFAEAARISASDEGRLLGMSLYVPMIVVDAETPRAIANQGVDSFRRESDLHVGLLARRYRYSQHGIRVARHVEPCSEASAGLSEDSRVVAWELSRRALGGDRRLAPIPLFFLH